MAEGNVASGGFQWIIVQYKSMPSIVVRTMVGTVLSTGDIISDVITIHSLFGLGYLGQAYALLTMACVSLALQVGPAFGSADASQPGRHRCVGSGISAVSIRGLI